DSFQEVDITGITHPITKHNYIVKNVNELSHIIRQAFAIARSGRPGPVLVDIPRDIQMALTDYVPMNIEQGKNNVPNNKFKNVSRDISGLEGFADNNLHKAIEAINQCQRP